MCSIKLWRISRLRISFCLLIEVVLYCIGNCADKGEKVEEKLRFYEYGYHTPGERLVLQHQLIIPAFIAEYHLYVMHNKSDFEPRYTFLRVEYVNILSKVMIRYDWINSKVVFKIRLPFATTRAHIVGYATLRMNKLLKIPHNNDEAANNTNDDG